MVTRASVFRRKFGRTITCIVLVLVSSIGLYKLSTRLFYIQTIEVIGQGVDVHIDGTRISRNLLFFPAEKLRARVLLDNPLLSDVQFQKKYPHTLRIIPMVRTPFVRLQTLDRLTLLDRSGIVLTDGDNGLPLPILAFSIPAIRVGEAIMDARVKQALAFIEGARSFLPIESITEIEGGYLQAKTGKTDIFFPQDRQVGDILATLQTLMTGVRIKGTLPAVVDLRFDKPIIK
ncbi:hypothetical protein A2Z00_02120 [Candidatus Gottesmanbacteria bacterium RBG_13_45_10]|uniref:POTRA domain-containing protein n=1 Tax=Candidatus Gottesmanbacteria bacterium RBG_13_45_10 TaxID=1798370 RepID=A0A1F5ZFI5_9BACT|nr:MAG: hypothetical protein A2Z00_02120 [Candidatus Gottesmanbacteria bacterium RBG_13_45_10]